MTAPSNANTSGLAPCPFCGGEAWLNDYEAKYSDLPPMSRAPQCRSCGASLGYLTTPAKATEAWNRRVTAASAQARITELERWQAAAIRSARIHDENIREFDARATAAEARADRLAKALERAADDLRDIGTQKPQPTNSPDPEHENYLRRVLISLGQVGNARARAALQQETQK